MGFDISYHPIAKEQMDAWYFDRLPEVVQGDFSQLQEIGKASGMDEFYVDKYIETMKVAATTDSKELFEKCHAYFLAIVQGFFSRYFYTRGTPISFLINQNAPEIKKYITSWHTIKPAYISCPIADCLPENYSGGVYMSPGQVSSLLAELEQEGEIKELFLNFFQDNFPVFIEALRCAQAGNMGLLEASEVVEPNPIDLNQSTCYSNLFNCDPEGALIYQQIARAQLQEAMKNHKKSESKPSLKSFFKKLFGK